jgi:hypothetical protein
MHRRLPTALLLTLFAVVAPPAARAVEYLYPFLEPSENQAVEGVRRYDATNVLLACSYTLSGSATQGMWWVGSLTSGSGTPYQVLPQISGQTVTSSLYYGPNTAFANPALGSGTIQIVGSYKYAQSPTPSLNNGVLYTGPVNGSGGTWTQFNVPSNLTSGTVANTIPHSVMGELVVGNYDLVDVPGSGNAFLYNTVTNAYTIFNLGGTQNLTSAYGIWQNSADSYTIVGGSQIGGINKAFIMDYVLSTGSFGTPTFFAPRGEEVTIYSHFEGISGLGGDRYALIGMTIDSGSDPIGVDYVVATRNLDGSFSRGDWVPIAVPGASTTTGNTVIDDFALGIYTTSTSAGTAAYVAAVPEPGSWLLAAIGAAGLGIAMRMGRTRNASAAD